MLINRRKSTRVVGSILTLAILACSATVGARDERDHDHDRDHDQEGSPVSEAQVKRGFEIVPSGVFLNLHGKNKGLVGLGSYLVNTSGCADCHTHPTYLPGGDPFKGQRELINFQQYMTGGAMFGPFITSANLTPDANGRPAGLTRREFIQTLQTGHNPNDPAGQILQVMPWPAFGKKTEQDLSAIYEYLRALPSLPDNPAPGP
jgi:hypothetical protein